MDTVTADSRATVLECGDFVPVLLAGTRETAFGPLSLHLEARGLRPVRTCTPGEAEKALSHHDFAAIVLDLDGGDGPELARRFSTPNLIGHVPVLALTEDAQAAWRLLRAGLPLVDVLPPKAGPELLESRLRIFIDLFRRRLSLERLNGTLKRQVARRTRTERVLREMNQELEQRIVSQAAILEEGDRRKDGFLAALAHELRNPLAPIRAAVEVIRLKGPEDEHLQQAGQVIGRQVEHLCRLLDDLLDMSRLTRDKLALQISRVSLETIVAAAIETSRPIIEQRRHTLTVHPPEHPVWLDADPARLSQVLSNLLSNAAKYTPSGGRIRLESSVSEDGLEIRVADTGVGIATEHLSRVFDMFMQATSTRRFGDGLGVGLALARRLVEMHGGQITAHSDGPGHGAEFIIDLPLPVVDLAEVPPPRDEPTTPNAGGRRLRVLVVDDNKDAAEMLVMMLEAWGVDTAVAFDGHAALRLGPTYRPDVVLLDLGMPNIDGYETARRARQHPWGTQAVLVALTGWGRPSDRERTRAAGFDHHLVKPVAPDMIDALLASCIALRRHAES